MKINEEVCVGCQSCVIYCPVEAIITDGEVYIDQNLCVECGACVRSGACKYGALYQPELEWPRVLRAQFSDPLGIHPSTGISGRGTCEMKTNDVTGRFDHDEIGIAVEVGRPSIATSFFEVEKLTKALAGKVDFEQLNPLTKLIDNRTGEIKDPSVRSERVLSAIIECITSEDKALEILKIIKDKEADLNTVFSVCVINKCKNFTIPFKEELFRYGYEPRINGKTNVGLGRPLV